MADTQGIKDACNNQTDIKRCEAAVLNGNVLFWQVEFEDGKVFQVGDFDDCETPERVCDVTGPNAGWDAAKASIVKHAPAIRFVQTASRKVCGLNVVYHDGAENFLGQPIDLATMDQVK